MQTSDRIHADAAPGTQDAPTQAVHAASVPPCPANRAIGHLMLMIAAVGYYKHHGRIPEWAK